jgi:hypothetical protein
MFTIEYLLEKGLMSMWIRSAFWTGLPYGGQEEAFATGVNDELIPGLLRLPGVKGAKAMWPRRREDAPPDVACQILVHFESEQDIDHMLASPERQALREKVQKIAGLFNGAISHIDFELS